MRRIDVERMDLVHYGLMWPHSAAPCNRAMIAHLERNEGLVYWLQPRGAGVDLQIPALRLKDGFYTLSLRMMKAIWRHVRLRKGFCNLERAQLGGFKLRIPAVLLTEKMRTQSRFNVSAFLNELGAKMGCGQQGEGVVSCRASILLFELAFFCPQVMRMLHGSSTAGPPKADGEPPAAPAASLLHHPRAPMSAAAKISRLVDELFLPMALEGGERYTSFLADAEADERAAVARLCELRPWIGEDREAFVEAAGELYDRHVVARLV